jgi:uncharacterized cupin superfamily protein
VLRPRSAAKITARPPQEDEYRQLAHPASRISQRRSSPRFFGPLPRAAPPRREFVNTSSVDTFNLFRDETIGDESDPPGYRARSARLAPRLGASRVGMTVYDLPAGEAICPYHFHWGDEEWLIVVSGTPTVRTADGEQTLEPGDVVCFRVGPQGAHRVHNASDDTARVACSPTSTSSASSNIPTATRSASGAAMTRRSIT